jgi:hypothetical protein
MILPLSEETALLNIDGSDDLRFDRRLDHAEPMEQLAELFGVNCLVGPYGNSTSSLVPPEARAGVAEWIRSTDLTLDDGILTTPASTYEPDVPICTPAALADRLGVADLDWLPDPRADWRLVCDVFVLVDRAIYTVGNGFALRHKVLGEAELGIAYSARLLPFADDVDIDALVFLSVTPGRIATNFGGVRAHRTAYLESGIGLEVCRKNLGPIGSWQWHTEFFDDAACRILSLDGVDAIPLVVGVKELTS